MFRCTGSSDDRIWIPPVLGKYCLPSFFFHFFSPFPSSALSSLLPSLSFLLPHYTYSPRNTRRCLYSAPHWIHHVLALAKLQVKTFILHINEEWSSSRDAWRREIQNLSTGTVEGWKKEQTGMLRRDRIYQPRNERSDDGIYSRKGRVLAGLTSLDSSGTSKGPIRIWRLILRCRRKIIKYLRTRPFSSWSRESRCHL